MTHVKAMSADGVWAYVGTGNFDELSLCNNREVSLSISSSDVVGELDRTVFLPDMAVSQELRRMPAPKNSAILELMDSVLIRRRRHRPHPMPHRVVRGA